MSTLLVSCSEHLYPVAWCVFSEWLGTSCHRFSRIPKQRFAYTSHVVLRPTTHFLSSQILPVNSNSCTRRLIADLASACRLLNIHPTKLSLHCHKIIGLIKVFAVNTCSSMLYAILHTAPCLLGCELLTFHHPVFTFITSHSIVSRFSNCYVYFWISYIHPLTSKVTSFM